MFPPFRSIKSVASFCILLASLLSLPVVTRWIGHPSREQAYASLPDAAGLVGAHIREMYRQPGDPDILFLGSSLVHAAIDTPTVEDALSAHIGRRAHVDILALNWQGLDLQYFLLRDYLDKHHPSLLIWNLPVPGSRNLEPHIEAFHWIRFGEYSDALSGLPFRYRIALYGDMVLGAPRELLSYVRPSLLSEDEINAPIHPEKLGYYGAPFIAEPTTAAPVTADDSYQQPPYELIHCAGKPLNAYEAHFANLIVKLAREKHIDVALVHIPIDGEIGLTYMPERGRWADALHTNAPMIGVPSGILFRNTDPAIVHNYYRDQHFNINGSLLYTRTILPGIIKAYDERQSRD
jgi:hypothetical protein